MSQNRSGPGRSGNQIRALYDQMPLTCQNDVIQPSGWNIYCVNTRAKKQYLVSLQ